MQIDKTSSLTKDDLYLLQDALISYKYGRVNRLYSKDKIRTIQKKLFKMEDLAEWLTFKPTLVI